MAPRRKHSGIPALFGYFLGTALLGSVLLSLPGAWDGAAPLRYVDALFTSVSAVCVTGLITVDTASYSAFGRITILVLIEAGGLGIITFAAILLLNPGGRVSLARRRSVTEYYVETMETDPRRIVIQVVGMTLALEALGTAVLYAGMGDLGRGERLLAAVFHAGSALCNAGFSTFSENLERYQGNPVVVSCVMALVVLGGLGFVVLRDMARRVGGRSRRLTLHSRVVLVATMTLIVGGAVAYLALEGGAGGGALPERRRVLHALFQSVTTRTAGFNTFNESALSVSSKLLTIALMFIGGAPASTAGGVKVTTAFICAAMIAGGTDSAGELRVFGRRLKVGLTSRAATYALRACVLVFTSVLGLTITECVVGSAQPSFLEMLFESVSAFGTVGLSLGITGSLSVGGKIVIMATMFAGRVGLLALVVPTQQRKVERRIDHPSEEVLIG